MTSKVLLLGKSGQVGQALHGLLASHPGLIACDRSSCDLSSPQSLRQTIEMTQPQVIINAAAYTAVDQAERDQAACRQINAAAPEIIAEAARRLGALLVHFSTDYVFGGTKSGPYTESDQPNPLSIYGTTKLDGDRAVTSVGCDHVVLRVAWVYSAVGRNFAKTVLRLAAERDTLSIVNDQFGAPTSADLIAEVTSEIVRRHVAGTGIASGLYNLAPAGRTSWHGFATELVKEGRQRGLCLRIRDDRLIPIPSSSYPTPAKRPSNSSLNAEKLEHALGIKLRDWRVDVKRVVSKLAATMQPA